MEETPKQSLNETQKKSRSKISLMRFSLPRLEFISKPVYFRSRFRSPEVQSGRAGRFAAKNFFIAYISQIPLFRDLSTKSEFVLRFYNLICLVKRMTWVCLNSGWMIELLSNFSLFCLDSSFNHTEFLLCLVNRVNILPRLVNLKGLPNLRQI